VSELAVLYDMQLHRQMHDMHC